MPARSDQRVRNVQVFTRSDSNQFAIYGLMTIQRHILPPLPRNVLSPSRYPADCRLLRALFLGAFRGPCAFATGLCLVICVRLTPGRPR